MYYLSLGIKGSLGLFWVELDSKEGIVEGFHACDKRLLIVVIRNGGWSEHASKSLISLELVWVNSPIVVVVGDSKVFKNVSIIFKR